MILQGDCLELILSLDDNSLDAMVTDPPYGLNEVTPKRVTECLNKWLKKETYTPKGKGYNRNSWDTWVPGPEIWSEAYRVLKPGAYALVFASTRTQDLMSIALRLSGFEICDSLQWLHKGMPKNSDMGKLVDKKLGVAHLREVIGEQVMTGTARRLKGSSTYGAAATGDTREFDDTTIPITRAYSEEAKRWEGWGTGLKPTSEPIILARKPCEESTVDNILKYGVGALNIRGCRIKSDKPLIGAKYLKGEHPNLHSRHPANAIIDEAVAELLEAQVEGTSKTLYVVKASKQERKNGLTEGAINDHPTVKPIELMQYLVRLVTPVGGKILDPFVGSGSTLCAAILEGVDFVGFEQVPEYYAIAQERVASALSEKSRQSHPQHKHPSYPTPSHEQ